MGSTLGVLNDLSELALEIDTRGGISFGGKVLNPGFESFTESLLPWEFGRLELGSDSKALSNFSQSFLSSGGIIDLQWELSFPMALQVCAKRARGLFFASS